MKSKRKQGGFTLLEIIIVIIIVGVLASLAMPRFFKTIEYSRGMEALAHLGTLRQSMQRCYLYKNHYSGCGTVGDGFSQLDVEDPGIESQFFSYDYDANATPDAYTIRASRWDGNGTAVPPGGPHSIWIDQDGQKGGSGFYSNVR